MKGHNPLLWGVAGALVGFAVALIFCWFTWVRPLNAQLDAREKSLHEWERINRQEREAIATIKTISTGELAKWVATVDEQNKRFAELQCTLHQQEVELTGPATSYILIAAVAVIAVTGLVVFWLRDANAAAATTLENVASLAPDDMMRALLVASIANRDPINVLVSERPATPALPPPPIRPALMGGDSGGVVILFLADKGYGFILPDGESERVWFHIHDVLESDRASVSQGARVAFRRGTGKKGLKAVFVRCHSQNRSPPERLW